MSKKPKRKQKKRANASKGKRKKSSSQNPPSGAVFLYLIQANEALYKIGITTDICRRVKQLQTGNPEKLYVRSFIQYPGRIQARRAEQNLHKMFNHSRKSGEWFDFSDPRTHKEMDRVWNALKISDCCFNVKQPLLSISSL